MHFPLGAAVLNGAPVADAGSRAGDKDIPTPRSHDDRSLSLTWPKCCNILLRHPQAQPVWYTCSTHGTRKITMNSSDQSRIRTLHRAEPHTSAVPHPETRGETVAYWISQLGSPPSVAVVALLLTISQLSEPHLWLWTTVYLFLALFGPLTFLIWQVRQGNVTDLDIHFRQQRKSTLLVTAAGFALTWAVMSVGNAPSVLRLMAGAGLLQWVAVLLVTLRWKISIHTTSASGMTLFLVWLFGAIALPMALIVLSVAWSRIKLHRHTPAQVTAGIGLGLLVFYVALLFSPSLQTPGIFMR